MGTVLKGAAQRLAAALAVLYGAATLAFIALQLIPGDPVDTLLGPATTASAAVRAQIAAQYGFNQPVAEQYLRYLSRLLHGDLGQSYQLQRPVSALITEQLGPTAQLAAAALVLAVVIALVSAVATAGRSPALRSVAVTWELVAVSSPSYWVGILLLTGFSFQLQIFPVAGAQDFSALVLPAFTLALPIAGVLAQVLREGLETALTEPFAVTARARGLSRTAVRLKHTLRHAAVPLLTLTGWLTGSLLGGAVLVEVVFGRPGIGALTLQAVTGKDMPLVVGLVLLSAFVFVAISTLLDLLYLVIDPRLRTA
ncbi:MAG TPA: ABC transporter permease [Actinocrinis sp.]|nr:ABC transporter permease [Actinocrinis sp.]